MNYIVCFVDNTVSNSVAKYVFMSCEYREGCRHWKIKTADKSFYM